MSNRVRRPPAEWLATFLLFAQKGNLKAVAVELKVDPAAVRQRLRDLNRAYGLLESKEGTLVLSRKGRKALPIIRSLLRQYDKLSDWLNDWQQSGQDKAPPTGKQAARRQGSAIPPLQVNDTVGTSLPPAVLKRARRQFSEDEIIAGLREVRKTGGLELRDFIHELEQAAGTHA